MNYLSDKTKLGGGYDAKNNLVTFKSREDLKSFILTGEDNSKKLNQFYLEGFVPMKLCENTDSELFDKLTRTIYDYNLTNNVKFSKFDENELIINDKFAQVLSVSGEIKVSDSIYKYTSNGLFIVQENNYDFLKEYLSLEPKNKKFPEFSTIIENKIKIYIPSRNQFNDTFRIMPNLPCNEGDCASDGGGGAPVYPSIPENAHWYNNCLNTSSSWINNIFGKSYACEYFFNSSKKIRTVFAVTDYYLFFDVYADAEFKQSTWFGWFASREAKTVYLKINHANMTFTDREVNLNLTIGSQDVQNFWTQIRQLFTSSSQKRAAYISTLWERYNGSNSSVTYSPSFDELLISANTITNESRAYIVTPIVDVPQYNVQFDFSNFFGPQTNKVVVVTIMGENQAITNMDILKLMVDAYKKYGQNRNDIGVVVVNKELDTPAAKILSYSTGNDLVVTHNLAFASKNFNIPRSIKLNELLFLYSQNLNGSSTFGYRAGFTVKKVDKYDVDIESGAFFNNAWGGSRFKIVRN